MSISLGPLSFSHTTLLHRLEKGVGLVLPSVVQNAKEKNRIKRLKRLAALLTLEDTIRIVDVGANPLTYDPPYKPLLDAGLCTVIGFEPQRSAYEKLEAQKGPHETYINCAVGDGSVKTFYDYKFDGLSSLFPIDQRIEKNIDWMADHLELNSQVEIETVSMDDIEAVGEIDFLKIDIQGGELLVLQNARNRLSNAIATQIEMRFLRIYEGEPCFGDVDSELHSQGFEIHSIEGRLKHMKSGHSQTERLNGIVARQILDHDFYYVKNLRDLEKLDTVQLKKLALLSDGVFSSIDPVFLAIDILADRGDVAKNTAEKYRKTLPNEYLV